MKKKFVLSAAMIAALGLAGTAQAAQTVIKVDDTKPGVVINKNNMMSADLAIWNPPSRYYDMTDALVDGGYTLFRFPNGSLSNDYHWNGIGKYDSTGLWITTEEEGKYAPGFLGETIYRGTTKDNYGFVRRSHLADGKMETMWWGEILDPNDPPWVVVEFPEKKNIDSLQISWGDLRPKAFQYEYWTTDYAEYPGVHQALTNDLKLEASVKVTGPETMYKGKSVRTRYVAIRFKLQDLPGKGVQIREMKMFSNGEDLLAGNEYKMYAMSTRNGDKARTDWTNIPWHFEEFMKYLGTLPKSADGKPAQAVICVNAGTGTSKEAAAWVRYANKVKGYNIKQWEIGNELDGEWEESGPISARHYAARYLEYARAMKAVDPTIILHGPLLSTHKMMQKGAGILDGKYWMEEFLRIVGEAEIADGKRYLDAVDLHNYPYWTPNGANAKDMLKAMLDVGPNMDTLDVWMKRHLPGVDKVPSASGEEKRRVFLSEFSTNVQGYSLLMDYPQATAMAMIFAQHAVRFGDRLQVLPWDAFGNLFKSPDDTWGTISMTALLKEGSWNKWKSLEPTAEYYGVYMTFKQFLEDGFAVVPVESSNSEVVAYALAKDKSARVLLANLSDVAQVVQIDRVSVGAGADKAAIEVDVFGEEQFKWVGDQKNAYPYPKMGPSGRRLNPEKSRDITIPPFGLVVAQINPRAVGTDKATAKNAATPVVLAAALEKKVMMVGDTVDLFVTAVQQNGQLTGATLKIPGFGKKGSAMTVNVTPDDGKWDASVESFHVKVPVPEHAKTTPVVVQGTGAKGTEIELTVTGLGGKKTVQKIPFRVRGAYRTTSVLQNFDNGVDAVDWFPVVGEGNTEMGAKVFNGNPPHGGFIRHDFHIEQPPTLGWPNYSGAYYVVPQEIKQSVGVVFDYATNHNNPDGYIEVQVQSDQVKDYDEFMVRLRNTHGSWVRDTLIWENMTQEGWGKTIPQLDPTKIKTINFRARHSGVGYISLDNIFLLQEDGTEVPMPKGLRRLR
ncbi:MULTISPECIES: discoidin domain-containing protein [unclassified Fibrobacter]|uniref:discoidin domain-containing protein n=1 Tax=unclassified Fibrobacter TaxID=2634177 RepID=UPI000D6C6E95|nr:MULTISPECIES: discoidin domain-containing protein [unclassified Fibrobacter]PWJ61245.1 glycosyl hydrolase family 44 [Fibrobacter sp. UWR4]PZW66084.1 glycosyl hydrolase family 44 [Fibrobacter sp. UWR1]